VTLVLLPKATGVAELARDGMAVGLMSPGMGSVPAEQTYLDVTQGNRAFDSLYDQKLPAPSRRCSPAWWGAVKKRADSAPADIAPGLLASTLESAGVRVRVGGGASCTFSRPPSEAQAIQRSSKKLSATPHPHPRPTFEAKSGTLGQLPSLVRRLRGNDLLIAIERAPPAKNRTLAIGIAGNNSSIRGELTSDSTRTDGYVLSTDVAPTILEHFGLEVPSAMSGQPIRAEGRVDVGDIEALAARMASISERRGPVIGLSLLVWLIALAFAIPLGRGRVARAAVMLFGLSVVYLPLLLLLGAALEPSQGAERLLVAVGAPVLAGFTLLIAQRGIRALAVACGLVVLAYAVDVIAGSPLTTLSLLGPNPGLGVRFYGIGNELEAMLAVLIVAGTGAALQELAPRSTPRAAAVVFLALGLACAFVFAAGRFGADVGAAITMPIGAGAAASKVATPQRRTALLVIMTTSLAFVGFISAIDLISGANAHLTRSVLDAGGFSDLAQVAQRRLQLSAHSFSRPIVFIFLPLLLAIAALAIARRETLRAWLAPVPLLAAGLLGALVAVVVGTLANDSGALVLEIGCAYLLVFIAFAWTTLDS
jgi:hypothetical protein